MKLPSCEDKECLKIWIDFLKFFLGTVVLTVIGIQVDAGLKQRELVRLEAKMWGDYLEHAIDQDVGVRKRMAEFFKSVLTDEQHREGWNDYFKLVAKEYDETEKEKELKAMEKGQIRDTINELVSDSISVDLTPQQLAQKELKLEQLRNDLAVIESEEQRLARELSVQVGFLSNGPNRSELLSQTLTLVRQRLDSQFPGLQIRTAPDLDLAVDDPPVLVVRYGSGALRPKAEQVRALLYEEYDTRIEFDIGVSGLHLLIK